MRWTVHSLNTSRGTTLEEFLDGLSDAELGLSRSAIARQLGVTQPTISRLFSGHVQNIELKTMVRVAEVLNSDLEFAIKPRPPLRSGA